MGKIRISLGKLAVLLAAGYLVYWFVGPTQPPSGRAVNSGSSGRDAPVGGPEESYALRPANSWPSLVQDAAAKTSVGADLFAANYYVVLDASGSMNEVACSAGQRKIEAAQQALAAFAASVPPDANLGLALFEERGLGERVPLGTANREAFGLAVEQAIAGGGTPLRSAIELAYARLTDQAQRQLGYGEYHLVVVTDGHASSGQEPRAVVDTLLAQSPVVLHTIGFCIGEHHALNQPGRTYYRAADDPQALRQGLDAVLAEAPSFSVNRFGR